MNRDIFEESHEDFRATVRQFVQREVVPHLDRWDEDHQLDREVWLAAGRAGLIGMGVPEEYGGAGVTDFRYRVVVCEELARVGAAALSSGFSLQDDIVIPYLVDLCTEEQKQRWLPRLASGEWVIAIAMTEPGAGSDLQGIRTTALPDGDDWLLTGQKTFITNGINADLVVVVARTEPEAGSRGISLLVVERDMEGFSRGRKLRKIGLQAQDTAELVFTDVRVPRSNLLGNEGGGFVHLMERLPRERLAIAVAAVAVADAVLDQTNRYCFEREAFGKPIGDFQNSRFVLAELATEVDVAHAFIDRCIKALDEGTLTAVDAAKVKWWTTELQTRTVDRCLQLHGGYGYMLEYPVAKAFVDSRVQTIYGGTTEVMKEIIGRDIAATYGTARRESR